MTFAPDITLSKALTDPGLFGHVFAAPSFWTWHVIAKLIDGLPLVEQREIDLFEQCTGRTLLLFTPKSVNKGVRRLILLAGRRAGKDRFLSAVAVWRAALCCDWRKYQSAGEQSVVILLGADKRQAGILRRYCQGLLQTPMLAREVTRNTDLLVEFRNGSSLEIGTNDARLVRGRSAIAVLGSECSYWKTDEHSASSDEEVVGAAEPSMAMCPDQGLLLLGSSVYRKRGFMFRQYRKLHGNDIDTGSLCWFAPSPTMNPQLPQAVIDRALAEDAPKARAEFLNQWREDLSDFLPLDVIEAVTAWGTTERAPQKGIKYFAFADAAGGTGKDSFTLAIGHLESDTVVIDLIRERAPRFVASDVIKEYATLMRSYGISSVTSDNYAGGLTADDWRRNKIEFKGSTLDKSEIYLRSLPLMTSKRVLLLDHGHLRSQLQALERRVLSGHEKVDHPQTASGHDDIANAVAGCLVFAARAAATAIKAHPHPDLSKGGAAYCAPNLREVPQRYLADHSREPWRSHSTNLPPPGSSRSPRAW
jgi:hypothetical protein